MKTFNKVLLAFGFLCLYTPSFAQAPATGCIDADIQGQAEGIKRGFTKQGMTVFQEAMLRMTSMEPVPIAVKLHQGITYQLIYVGNESSARIMMEIYDGKDKKIDEKIERGSSNSIIYAFTPKKTDVYLVTLTQKKTLKDMCGYFGVMMKGTQPVAVKKDSVSKQAAPSKAPAKTTTTATPAKSTAPKTGNSKAMPANQRPNPNRTKATNAAREQK